MADPPMGSSSRNPTPRRGETDSTGPITDSPSKQVMLHAERKDPVAISEVITGTNDTTIPIALTVIERRETYFGPELLLMRDDGPNYKLTAPGPDYYLLVWKAQTDDEGFCHGWKQIAEVKAEFGDDLPSYDICPECDQPIKSIQHERASLFGQCNGQWT